MTSLYLAYSYSTNLDEVTEVRINHQVKKNREGVKKILIIGAYIIILSTAKPKKADAVELPWFFFAEGFSIERILRRPREIVEEKVHSFLDAVPRPTKEDFDEIKEAAFDAAMDRLEKAGAQDEEKRADEMYEEIRKSEVDVAKIAENTGYKKENVQECKNHVFYNTHKLDRYVSLGEPVEIKRFDSNLKQAEAWKRLETGDHTEDDLTWLKHEKAEQYVEKLYDSGYSESHNAAEKHWSGDPWKKQKETEE